MFSPDSTRFVFRSNAGTMGVLDAVTGAELFPQFQPHELLFKPFSIVFSSDSSHIITSHDTVCIWDATTGHLYVSSGENDSKFQALHSLAHLAIDVGLDGWVRQNTNCRTLSKIPVVLDDHCSASCGTSVAVGDRNGCVSILNFPPDVFSNPATRPWVYL
jgi:WD40 repeat protein